MSFSTACDALRNSEVQVVMLKGPTGCGKTTYFPLEVMKTCKCSVIVVNPLRVATERSAERCASISGMRVGQAVGCYIGGRHNPSRSSPRIDYMTTGCFMDRMLYLDKCIVIVDEVDCGALANDVILTVLRHLLLEGQIFKVVLASATLKTTTFWSSLSSVSVELPETCRPFSLMRDYALEHVEKPLEYALELVRRWRQDPSKGHCMIFFAGRKDLMDFQVMCTKALPGIHLRVIAGWLNEAGLPPQERIIYLVTNAVEKGVTLPDVSTVIDFGMKKERDNDTLRLVECSKSEAQQRAGRAGRTGPGLCHHIFTEEELSARVDSPVPEIQRVPLEGLLLQTVGYGVIDLDALRQAIDQGTLDEMSQVFANQPSCVALASAFSKLEQLRMVGESGLTSLGMWCFAHGLEPSEAWCLWTANHVQCGESMALLLAARECDSPGMPGETPGDLLGKAVTIEEAMGTERQLEQLQFYRASLRSLGHWVRPAKLWRDWSVAHCLFMAVSPGFQGRQGSFKVGRRTYRASRTSSAAEAKLSVAHSWAGYFLQDVEPVTEVQVTFAAYLAKRIPPSDDLYARELAMELSIAICKNGQMSVAEAAPYYMMLSLV